MKKLTILATIFDFLFLGVFFLVFYFVLQENGATLEDMETLIIFTFILVMVIESNIRIIRIKKFKEKVMYLLTLKKGVITDAILAASQLMISVYLTKIVIELFIYFEEMVEYPMILIVYISMFLVCIQSYYGTIKNTIMMIGRIKALKDFSLPLTSFPSDITIKGDDSV